LKKKNLRWCYNILESVSRSFSTVIEELPNEIRDTVCIFYLVLRGLDTIEDDEKLDEELKLSYLSTFFEDIENENFKVNNVGKGTYKTLLEEFPTVITVYKRLPTKYKTIVKDITKEMALGMYEFIKKEVDTIKDYNLYCHYVAGIVGTGLSRIFIAYSFKNFSEFDKLGLDLSNEMGIFLQKVNIIRDFIQDIYEERVFWPKAVWSKYVTSLEEFKKKRKYIISSKMCKRFNKRCIKTRAILFDIFKKNI